MSCQYFLAVFEKADIPRNYEPRALTNTTFSQWETLTKRWVSKHCMLKRVFFFSGLVGLVGNDDKFALLVVL